jgi:stage III sporulation protein AF
MLLPENNLRKYVKVVLGLFIMVTLLIPLVNVISSDESWAVSAWQFSDNAAGEVATVLSNGERISSKLHEVTLKEGEDRLGRQVEALVALVPGVESVRAKVHAKAGPSGELWSGIEKVYLEIGLSGRQSARIYSTKDPGPAIYDDPEKADPELEDPALEEDQALEETAPLVTPVDPVVIGDPSERTAALKPKLDEGGAIEPAAPAKNLGSESLASQSVSQKEVELQVKNTVANFYGVPLSKIQVEFK